MRALLIAVVSLMLAMPAVAQEAVKMPNGAPNPAPPYQEIFAPTSIIEDAPAPASRLAGDRAFPNFIGFVSNPDLSIDPRSFTQLWPVIGNTSIPNQGRIPSGDIQVYGAGISIALSERFSFGLSRGGYAMSDVRQNRDGWLDLGGFFQYSLIRNIEKQFILTTGIQWLSPWLGSQDLFQGDGTPVYLAPYFTFGKELGCFHVLGTAGYQFNAGSARVTTDTFYTNLHFDVRMFGWFYPLVEFNSTWPSKDIDAPRLEEIRGFFGLGRHDTGGGLVTVAPGFNAVIVHNRLELGAVYQTPIYSKRDFRFHDVLVKMIVRY